MSTRFHLAPTGPMPCKASKRPCRYGTAQEHYKTREAAEAAFAKRQEALPKPMAKPGNYSPHRILSLYEAEKRAIRREKYSVSTEAANLREAFNDDGTGSVHRKTLERIAQQTNMPLGKVQERLLQGQAEKFDISFQEAKARSLKAREDRADNATIITLQEKHYSIVRDAKIERAEEDLKRIMALPQNDPQRQALRDEILERFSDDNLQREWQEAGRKAEGEWLATKSKK